MPDYTFDCVFWSSVWVRAASEEAARAKLLSVCRNVYIGFDRDGVSIPVAHIEDDGGASELLQIDGVDVE